MDVATVRGLRSSAALLSESMGVGVARLERSKRIDSRSIPRTSSRVVLPLDSALQELSQSLGESSGLWERPSTSASTPEVWHASAQGSVRRPWTTQTAPGQRRGAGRRRAAPTSRASAEEVRLEGMLREKDSDLEREGISRAALAQHGLSHKQASRLYRLLFLHSCGLQDVLIDITDHCPASARGAVLLRVWKVFVWLVEYLMADKASTEFSVALQQSADAMSMLQERYDEEEARCEELTGSLEEAVMRSSTLENEVHALHERLESSQSAAKSEVAATERSARSVVEQAQSMLHESDAYSQQIYGKLAEEREARTQLQSALGGKDAECEQLKQRLQSVRRAMQPMEENARLAKAEKAKVESELVRSRSEVASLTAAVSAERASLQQVRGELEAERAAVAELKKVNERFKKAVEAVQAKLGASTETCERFKQRLAQEKTRNARLQQQLDEATTTRARSEEQVGALETERDGLAADLEAVRVDLTEAQSAAATATARAEELEVAVPLLEQQLAESAKESQRLRAENTLLFERSAAAASEERS